MKIAMVRLDNALKAANLNARLILQVHDELVFEVSDNEIEQTSALIREIMESAYPMDVPLRVDIGVGQNWGETK
jgi:DNA polymerase-1